MPGPLPAPRVRVTLPLAGMPAPRAALARVADRSGPFLRLAGRKGFRGAPWSFLAVDPIEVLRPRRFGPRRSLTQRLAALRPVRVEAHGPPVPFAAGWAGYVGYEARSALERTPPPRPSPLGFPAAWLGRYDAVLAWDHRRDRTYVSGSGANRREARAAARRLERAVREGVIRPVAAGPAVAGVPRPRIEAARFRAAIAAVRRAVLAGDVFQANVSQRFDARLRGTPLDVFERLAGAQPAPYMTYCDAGDGHVVLSASPERFLRVAGRVLETDPMKGTRPRGATPAEDRRLRRALASSAKDRAELAMIVDLSRNDLARVCEPGSVRVRVPRRLVPFARVHQAIAVVRGRLARGQDRLDALAAAFPPGSVTGAPKVRAMEVIDRLEGEGRGPYCGAIGWFDEGGDMDLAVGIRTILTTRHTASYRVGGGITVGSDPHAEWRESLDKGRGLFAALCGREDES